jgi:hypothetical protein
MVKRSLKLYGQWDPLAPHAKIRAQIVPQPVPVPETTPAKAVDPTPPKRSSRAAKWAELLARVFSFDMRACQDCGGTLKIIAAIVSLNAIRAILTHLRLPYTPPSLAPPRFPDQLHFA